jgi:hypothetical protein
MAIERLTKEEIKRFARARAEGRALMKDPSYGVGLQYDENRNEIKIDFRCGASIVLPLRIISEFGKGKPTGPIELLGGDVISCEAMDIDIYLPGLIGKIFGPRLFAAAIGIQGGRRKSKAKAAAARINGRLGGRPRKQAVA